MGNDYVIDIFKLQVNHSYIFYLLSIIILIALILILYKLITTRSKILIFNYLWIFITIIPVHNFILYHGGYETRYLYLTSVGFCLFIAILLFKLSQTKLGFVRSPKIIITSLFILILTLGSFSIIRNTETLGAIDKKMETLVSGLKKYQSKISDSTTMFFITSPIGLITESNKPILNYRSNISNVLKMKMDEILNFSDNVEGYGQKYSFYFLLFIQCEENNKIKINWVNERTFILDNINPKYCYSIIKENSLLNKYGTDLNYVKHGHSILQSITSASEFIESNEAFIKVMDLDKKPNTAKIRVELKEELYKLKSNNIFFIYEEGHLQLLKEVSTQK